MQVCEYDADDVCSKALMSLFVLASKDGWVNIMYTGLDAVGVDQQVSWACLPRCVTLFYH